MHVLRACHQDGSVRIQDVCQSLQELNLKMQNLSFQYKGKISL